MVREGLKKILETQVDIPAAALDALSAQWTVERSLKRNEFLTNIGQTEQHLYWVIEGNLKIYYLHDGEEACVGFAYPETLVCSYPSFIKKKPTQYAIQAIKPCRLIGIQREHFYQLFSQYNELETAWRKLTEEALLGRMDREVEMLTFTPAERFERLFKRSPHIFQLIPHKYIASYLRMSPETFSRVKKRVWGNS